MRRLSILTLAILGLSTSILWAQGPRAQEPPRPHGKPNKILKFMGAASPNNFPEKSFIIWGGWQIKENDAIDDALEKARDQVEAYVREQKRTLEWMPKVAFVRERLLVDLRLAEVDEKAVKGKLEEILIDDRFRAVEETRDNDVNQPQRETRRVCVKVILNSETWKQIQKENRLAEDQRRLKVTEKRMVFLVKFLAGIVALLLTVCGYIRLDEWSKGYYTKWLRLVAIGCVATVTVLLWTLLAYR
jgi:hypothetical protein